MGNSIRKSYINTFEYCSHGWSQFLKAFFFSFSAYQDFVNLYQDGHFVCIFHFLVHTKLPWRPVESFSSFLKMFGSLVKPKNIFNDSRTFLQKYSIPPPQEAPVEVENLRPAGILPEQTMRGRQRIYATVTGKLLPRLRELLNPQVG
jgi:hypothetical protein